MFKDLLNTVKNYALIPWMGMLSDQLYQFLPSKDGYSLKASTNLSRIKYILLSREHYHEIQKDYPVESRKELDKIVKLELATKTDAIVLYRIGEYKNKKRIVTFAEINANIHSYFQHAYWLLCIPESWLISSIFEHQLVKVESKVAPYWLYSTGEKITSHAIKGLFSASSAFCAAVGISDNNKPVQLSKKQVLICFLTTVLSF